MLYLNKKESFDSFFCVILIIGDSMNDNEKVEELQEKQMEDQKLQELSNEELKVKIQEISNSNGNVIGTSNKKTGLIITITILLITLVGIVFFFWFMWPAINNTIVKPILYLYPEEDMDVKVSFNREDLLMTTYPKFNKEWNVHVKSDGSITDDNGRNYYALYWDEKREEKVDFKTGFYVKSEDSIKFLEEKLNEIGLTEREANEFIMYWLPKMEENGDNLVRFEFTKEREKMNKLNIEPKPDSMLRLGIVLKKVDKKVKIKEQKIEHFDRFGFSAVEWGGTIIN